MAYIVGLGLQVDGVAKAHANGDVDTFTVSAGGLVLVTKIEGIVTVAAGAACLLSIGSNPTDGTTTVWCVPTDVDTALVGDLLTIANVAGTDTMAIFGGMSTGSQFFAAAGTIFVRGTAVQGTSQWRLWYVPVVAGSTVVAIP